MKLKVVAIHDGKAELFSQPFFVVAVGLALRSFSDAINDGKSEYARHPEDYTLFLLGEYDDSKGELIPKVPVSLGVGLSFVVSNRLELELMRGEA